LDVGDLRGRKDNTRDGWRNRRCPSGNRLNRDLRISRRPDHFNVIGCRQAQHEVNRHQAIAIDATMPLLNAQARVAIRNIPAAAAVVFAQPDVNIVDLGVGVNKLDRECEAINARISKCHPTARNNTHAIIRRVSAV